MNSRVWMSVSTLNLNASGTSRLQQVPRVAVHGPDEQLRQAGDLAEFRRDQRRHPLLQLGRGLVGERERDDVLGSTSGRSRISTIRCEITWVLPEPAHATISSGSSSVPIAARWATVYSMPSLWLPRLNAFQDCSGYRWHAGIVGCCPHGDLTGGRDPMKATEQFASRTRRPADRPCGSLRKGGPHCLGCGNHRAGLEERDAGHMSAVRGRRWRRCCPDE